MSGNREDAAVLPELSVVIAIIEGGSAAITSCLDALAESANGLNIECIVPFDDRLDSVEDLKRKYRWVEFIDAREFVDASRFGSSSREHHDILRSIGLREAKAPIAALLEDHGIPSSDWCRALLRAYKGTDAAAVGGAVENGVDRLLNWAVYYCDFGRYQNPVPSGPVEFLSDSNVSYKRDELFSVKRHWFDSFHETSVNWELKRRGAKLLLDPRMVVHQTRRTLRFVPALRERFVWGRSFAGTRAQEVPAVRRALFAAFSFLLPPLLTWRIVLQGVRRKRYLGKLIASLPLVLLLETVWAGGEFVGYLTGKAASENRSEVQVAVR